MKISVIGFPACGKSTISRKLSAKLNTPLLYLDKLNFINGWKERSREDVEKDIKVFLSMNDSWVIDGSYTQRSPERFELADYIIILKLPALTCLKRAIKRDKEYKGKVRDDIAEGCRGRFSLRFYFWVVFGSRSKKRRNKIKDIMNTYPEKIVYLRSQKDIDEFVRRVENDGPIRES